MVFGIDDDEDDEAPKSGNAKSPLEVGPSVIWWLFVESTVRVMIPALIGMAGGIWLGAARGNKPLYGLIGTLLGLTVAGVLVWRRTKQL